MTLSVTALYPAPGATPLPQQTKRVLPNLDGIRAVACLLVVLSHIPVPGKFETLGSLGVCLFFVLSGFLMGHLYAAKPWDAAAVLGYGIARFSRIAPIYWLVVTLCVLLSLAEPEQEFVLRIEGLGPVLRHYLFSGNAGIFWSIPLEVQYYLFFLLVWWALAHASQRVSALPLLAVLCVVLLVTQGYWRGLMLPNKLHFFLVGTVAGLAPRPAWTAGRETVAMLLLQAVALLLLIAPPWLYASQPAMYASTPLALLLGLGVYLLSMPSRWSALLLATPWMRKIGQSSFSIYLLHMLVIHYGMRLLDLQMLVYAHAWLLLGLASVALPMLVSHWIEIPLQKRTRDGLQKHLLKRLPNRPRLLQHPVNPPVPK
ncbi:MAG: acyltransferase [Rhodoferax sp.]|nr:acyltransferase [Rhodoferax sp.]